VNGGKTKGQVEAEISEAIVDILSDIAPDEDCSNLTPDVAFRDQLELDSMDFLDIVMELRKRYRVQIPEPPDFSQPSHQAGSDGLLSRRALELVRAEFENRTWEAFWRTAVDGQAPADVAEDLGMSLHAVYKAKSRVLRRLRQELNGLLE
jgi:acyl carrier protein